MADACERCGSTRFYIDNGLRYCINGHEQAGGQQVAEADEEYLTQGRRTKRKKEKRPVKASKSKGLYPLSDWYLRPHRPVTNCDQSTGATLATSCFCKLTSTFCGDSAMR